MRVPPAATVADVLRRRIFSRGVWKAPSRFQAVTNNVTGVVPRGVMTDQRQGTLNPLGVNCLRHFPTSLPSCSVRARWRPRPMSSGSTCPVKRMALFLEQTLYANLKWVIFEPNAQPLSSAITLEHQRLMLGLFKQGAFQGDYAERGLQREVR